MPARPTTSSILVLLAVCLNPFAAHAQATAESEALDAFEAAKLELPVRDRLEYFAGAFEAGETGLARKTKSVDARPAIPGEVVVSIIAGDGVETVSPPAAEGDWVVRNRCPETGNEEILVTAAKFPTRYGEAQTAAAAEGYREFIPTGAEMRYFVVPEEDGEFMMEAPWGEMQIFKPGDAVVQVVSDPNDTYRIYGASFVCTYEILEEAGE